MSPTLAVVVTHLVQVHTSSASQDSKRKQRKDRTMGRVIERVEYPTVPTGAHKVILTSIEEKVGQFGEQFRLSLEVIEGEFEGRRLTAWCSPVLSPKSKLTRWAAALLGDEMPEGALDVDWLINRTAVADVLESEGKDGATFSKVVELRPIRRPIRPTSPAPRPAPAAATRPAKASTPPPADDDPAWDSIMRDEAAALGETSLI